MDIIQQIYKDISKDFANEKSDNKTDKKKTDSRKSMLFYICIFMLCTGYIIYTSKEKREKFTKLITNNRLMFFLIMILFSSYYIFYTDLSIIKQNDNKHKLKVAVKHALIALVIAIFSSLDLIIAPFFLAFILSYFMDIELS
tara:strand:- start:612 stop:1037 length:426 start_codon:yes stop_codon:yes gene_type:complete